MTIATFRERRRNKRHNVNTQLRFRGRSLAGDTGVSEPAELLDLSLSGARFECDFPLRMGAELELMMKTNEGFLALVAEVVRTDEGSVGVRFTEMTDDTRVHLGRYLAEIAEAELMRQTRKRPPRPQMSTYPGRTTQVL
jgi:hypothetical protein